MTSQIAVKLPEELLAAVDRLVRSGWFANRSEVVRAGLQIVVDDHTTASIDGAFAAGFERTPDSPAEVRRVTALAIDSIEEEPWEKWW